MSNEIKSIVLKWYPKLLENKGADFSGNGKIEKNEELKDVNSNKVTGDKEDIWALLGANICYLQKELMSEIQSKVGHFWVSKNLGIKILNPPHAQKLTKEELQYYQIGMNYAIEFSKEMVKFWIKEKYIKINDKKIFNISIKVGINKARREFSYTSIKIGCVDSWGDNLHPLTSCDYDNVDYKTVDKISHNIDKKGKKILKKLSKEMPGKASGGWDGSFYIKIPH